MNAYIQQSKEQSQKLQADVKQIILDMITHGEVVNFYTVAEKANVSRTFLYKHEDIKQAIRATRLSSLSKKELQQEVMRLRVNSIMK